MALIVFKNIIVVFILYIHMSIKKITSGSSSSFGDLKKKKKTKLYFLYFIENIVLLMFPNATEKWHFLK